MSRVINHLVVHCSATREGQHFTAKDIDRWHRARGWRCIGYHYVILLDGTVEKGRPEDQAGAHVEGYNTHSIGICLIGGLSADGKTSKNTFTAAQFASLDKLLRELKGRYKTAEILGHRDFPNVRKDCPCFDVREWCRVRGL